MPGKKDYVEFTTMFRKHGDSPENLMGAIGDATAEGKPLYCGWIPPDERDGKMKAADVDILAGLPMFNIRGRWANAQRRYKLWEAGKLVMGGKFLPYNWQQTGSCVGAGGGNMAKTAICVEINMKAEAEQYLELWWLHTYGRSRFLGGIKGPGEGSFGSAWAKAATVDGFFEIDPAGQPDLPDYQTQDGWLVQPASTELKWSDGGKIQANWLNLGRTHLFGTASRIRNKHEAFEAIANGYPLTQASSFGFTRPKVKGTKNPIRVAEWNGTWHHQTWVDEAWDHEELNGIYFRWGNNWGPMAHGAPTGDEPPGGVYIHEDLMDRLCKEGEVYAFSRFNGFPARDLPDFSTMFRPRRSSIMVGTDHTPAA